MVELYRVTIRIKERLAEPTQKFPKDYTFVNKRSLIKFLESFGLINVRHTLTEEGVFSDSGLVHCFSTYADVEEYKEGTPIAYITVNPIRPDTILELCPSYGTDLLNTFKAEKQIPA